MNFSETPSHTPEPWLKGEPEIGYSHEIDCTPAEGMAILPLVDYDRAIACVNALAGITNPEAVGQVIEALRDAGKRFRDYEALHLAKETHEGNAKGAENARMAERCEESIAALETKS